MYIPDTFDAELLLPPSCEFRLDEPSPRVPDPANEPAAYGLLGS
jgi:hypothetical protein